MSNGTTITVDDTGTVTVENDQATITVKAKCPPQEPAEFTPDTSWPVDASSSLRFSFLAGALNSNVGFGFDGEYYGTVNEFPDGVSLTDHLFTLSYRTDLNRSYVTFQLNEDVPGGAARVTVTDAVTGESQTFLGTTNSGQFVVQEDATLVLVEGNLYYVEFAVPTGGG